MPRVFVIRGILPLPIPGSCGSSAAPTASSFQDIEPRDSSYWVDFDAAGRLVTSSFDGRLRLYDADYRQLAVRGSKAGSMSASRLVR